MTFGVRIYPTTSTIDVQWTSIENFGKTGSHLESSKV